MAACGDALSSRRTTLAKSSPTRAIKTGESRAHRGYSPSVAPCSFVSAQADPPHNKRSSVSARQELLRGRPDGPTTPISEPPADESALEPEREDRKGRPRPAVMIPLAPELYKIQITVSRETHDNLRRAQDLLRHVIPDGDPAAIVDRALTLLVEDLERTRLAATARPRSSRNASPSSRHVPASVRRQVWARDGGQCAFAGKQGRCTERGFLEIHHLVPFAAGGPTNVENLELRCRCHNQYEAEGFFGPLLVRETRCGYRATPFEPSWSANHAIADPSSAPASNDAK
jgi:HNH endonuclease